MKRYTIFLIMLCALCLVGQHSLGQISAGGKPMSFSLEIDKEKIPVLVMPPIDIKALLQEDEKARKENVQIPFKFGCALNVNIDVKKNGMQKEWTGGGTNNSRLSNWLDPNNTGILVLDGCTATFSNRTVITNQTVVGCNDLEVEDITVTNNARLSLDALGIVRIEGGFKVEIGSSLRIK